LASVWKWCVEVVKAGGPRPLPPGEETKGGVPEIACGVVRRVQQQLQEEETEMTAAAAAEEEEEEERGTQTHSAQAAIPVPRDGMSGPRRSPVGRWRRATARFRKANRITNS
jgi:hypothetical protein